MGIPNTMAYMLDALRNDFYEAEGLPFRDPMLGVDRVTYPDAYKPGLPFFGAALVTALADLLGQIQPTYVVTHHPKDDHRDHRATAFFARKAVDTAVSSGKVPSRPNELAMLVYYKRIAWPPPGDSFLTEEIAQHPFGLDVVPFELTRDEQTRKKRACQVFVPTLRQDYIDGYMKRDEVFWTLDK
jgi:LmbE family N-acetylglucosaminyl deacetylase